MNKYRSAVEKIEVTPQMEERILSSLSRKKETVIEAKKKPDFRWVRYASILATCCAGILCVMLIYPSLLNFNQGDKLVKNPQKVVVTESVGNSAEVTAQPEKQQEQAPKSAGNPSKTAVQPEKQQAQVPKVAGNSAKNATQPEKQQTQEPKSVGDSGGTPTQPGKQQDQAPASAGNSGEADTTQGGQQVLDSNPIEKTNGVEELKKVVKFELFIPGKLPAGYEIDSTSILFKELAQIIYSDGNNEITYRVSRGAEDVSGDYTSYEKSEVIKVNNIEVTLKGSNSLINLATWINDGCSYALSFSTGLEKKDVVSVIESMGKA